MKRATEASRRKLNVSREAARRGIKITRVNNRSRGKEFGEAWLVIVPAKAAGGRRIRKQFALAQSKEAVAFAERQAALARDHGTSAFQLTGAQTQEASKVFRLLVGSGLSLEEVVRAGLRHLRPEGGDKTLGELRDLLLAEKRRENLRTASLYALSTYLRAMVEHFGAARHVKTLSHDELRAWIAELESAKAEPVAFAVQPGDRVRPLSTICTLKRGGVAYEIRARAKGALHRWLVPHDLSAVEHGQAVAAIRTADGSESIVTASLPPAGPRHVRNYIRYAHQLLEFARERKYVAENAAKLLKAPHAEGEAPAILTVEEAKQLLRTAMLPEFRSMLPATVIALFCGGMRTEEIKRLKWEHVDLERRRITVAPSVGKNRRVGDWRYPEIPAGAVEFLLMHGDRTGPITPKGFSHLTTAFHRAAGFPRWHETHDNSKRHSFGSYFCKLKGVDWVVDQMGNSARIFIRHYRNAAVTTADAEAYAALAPADLSHAPILPLSAG